jgi:hypothetical protein
VQSALQSNVYTSPLFTGDQAQESSAGVCGLGEKCPISGTESRGLLRGSNSSHGHSLILRIHVSFLGQLL